MATKIISAKPGKRLRRTITKQSPEQRLIRLYRELGLDPKHELRNLDFKIKVKSLDFCEQFQSL